MDRLNYINSGNAAYIDSLYDTHTNKTRIRLILDGKSFLKGLILEGINRPGCCCKHRNTRAFFKGNKRAEFD